MLLAPTTPYEPTQHVSGDARSSLSELAGVVMTVPSSLAGLPALTIPNGLQLIGPALGESMLFRVGRELRSKYLVREDNEQLFDLNIWIQQKN